MTRRGVAPRVHPLRGSKKLAVAVVFAAVASLALSACGSASNGATVTITLYNGQHEQTTDSLVAGFEKEYPDISVAVRSDDEDTFDAEIVQEGSRSPADVFYTENSPALEYLQQRGLLAKVDASTLADTPAKYNSPVGDWVGVSARVS
ncbi:MAG: extracellular solute-binding protein, partial [Acidimicrobiales bacterium]